VIRKTENGPKEIYTSLKKIIDGKERDLLLEADDILFVPHSGGKAAMQSVTTIMQGVAGAAIYRF